MKVDFSNRLGSFLLTCLLLSSSLSAQASMPDETTTITLDHAVHFLGTDGSDVVAEPGDYSVETAEEWLRLIPGTERRNALLVEAQKGTHDVPVEIPIVLSTPGDEPDELDMHIVQFLNPDGTSMVATGTYSGIYSRGWFDGAKKAAARARARARAAAERARRVAAAKARQAAEAARAAALKAKQDAERIAKEAAQKAQALALKAKLEAERQAKILACKATVSAIKSGKTASQLMQPALSAIQRQGQVLHNQIKNDPQLISRMSQQGEGHLKTYEQLLPEMKRIAAVMNDPKNKAKLNALISAENICSGNASSVQQQLNQLGLTPKFAMVQSRAVKEPIDPPPGFPESPHFYMSYNFIGFTATVVKGITGGISLVTDHKGNSGWFWSLGNEWGLGLGFGSSVGFFPKVTFDSFGGEGESVRAAFIAEVELEFDENWKWQGFAVGAGAKGEGGYATTYSKQF